MSSFEGTISGENLQSILDVATVFVERCRVFITDDEIRIRGTDPADNCLVVIDVSNEAFESVSFDERDVCWDFTQMADMVNTADRDSKVSLELLDHNIEISVLDLNFTLTLENPDYLKRDREKPELKLDGEVVMESAAFKRGINAANLVANHVEFGIDSNRSLFYMQALGDVNEVIMRRSKRDLQTLTSEEMTSEYSLDYLNPISNAIPKDSEVQLNFDEDYPAEISFKIVDGSAEVTYFVAPKVDPNK